MGCKETRQLSDEEKLMVKYENSLKYHSVKSRQAVMLFKKHSRR